MKTETKTIAKILLSLFIALTCVDSACAQKKGESVLSIRADAPGISVSPALHGAFFEDINSGADGGLYAELIKNRSFEFPVNMEAWTPAFPEGAVANVDVRSEGGLSPANPTYLRMEIKSAAGGVKISNSGFNGIAVEKQASYRFSVYARSPDGTPKGIVVRLETEDRAVVAQVRLTGLARTWKRFQADMVPTASATMAVLTIVSGEPGTLDLDMASLFPAVTWKDQPNGLRADLAGATAGFQPAFMRFPGGCIVEGISMRNAYRWKDTIGDPMDRPVNRNLWGYKQSYGLGFYEYFRFYEDIGAEPLPVVNRGMACQVRGGNMTPVPDLGPLVQDALDLIEYANGPADRGWGAKRAASGHPASFNMKYLGIGNEN
jgi:hypothetical protein